MPQPNQTADFLAIHAAQQGDTVAVVEGDRSLTFDQFNRLVNRYANVLVARGLRVGDKVLWVGQNGLEVAAIAHACRKVGAVNVPMNYRLAPDEARYVIDNADAVVVLFDLEQAPQLEDAPAACLTTRHWLCFRSEGAPIPPWSESLDAEVAAASDDEPVVAGEHPAAGSLMFYTSGTTGRPKGTVRAQADPAVGAALVQLIGYQPDDVYLTTGPLYHSGPLSFMLIVQQGGGRAVIQRKFDPEAWLALVQEYRVTTTFSAPTPIRRVVDLPAEVRNRYDASSLARVVANAAPWPFELKRKYVQALGEGSLWEVYGSSELGVDTVLTPEDQMRKPGSCGRPAPLVDIKLFDDEGREVSEPMVPGEVFVRSGMTFTGYYKDQDKFERSRRGEYLSVGDVAYRDDEGYIYICDRKSDMIISGGMNIYPAEIEAVLVAHPAVADAAVFGIPSEEWGESVHAVVSLYEGKDATDDELGAFAREHLGSYKVPRSFSRLDEIPRNCSGKILKRELRAPYWAGRTSNVG